MPLDLQNEVVLITGAGRGIGRATALRLARTRCTLALVARTETDVRAVADAVMSFDCRALALSADVTDDTELELTLRRVVTELGTVTMLINNAGWAPPRQPVSKAVRADWDRLLATCLRAPMVLTHLLLPDMLARQHGAIVNVASVAAQCARAGEAAYAAAKAGLLAFTRALFAEVRDHGVRVCAVCPGYVDTALVPTNRRVNRSKFLRPEDVAEAIFQVLTCDPRVCPTQVVLEPQFDPEKA
jgi:NAD(P)-dependent dehydrogenase (short-subunit alcohol dehydrogenase family)